MKQLIIIGDSVMKGVVYTPEQRRYHLMHGRRFAALEDAGIEVNNFSRFGATVARGYRELCDKLEGPSSDTAVLIGFGGNDCAYNWDAVSNNPDGDHLPITPREQFVQLYLKCIYYARSLGARVIVPTLVPIDAEGYMNLIAQNRNRENLLKWIGDVNLLYRWHEHYNDLVLQAADRANCETVDLRTPFLTNHAFKSLVGGDGIHPTEAGHRLIESTLTAYLIGATGAASAREMALG